MSLYEVEYVVKRRGREYPTVHTTKAQSAKEAIRKTIEYTEEYKLQIGRAHV